MPGLVDRCGVCHTQFPFSLARCAFCRRPFCVDCSVRIGGCSFCSKQCGHVFFYGGEEDVEDSGLLELEEDE